MADPRYLRRFQFERVNSPFKLKGLENRLEVLYQLDTELTTYNNVMCLASYWDRIKGLGIIHKI